MARVDIKVGVKNGLFSAKEGLEKMKRRHGKGWVDAQNSTTANWLRNRAASE